MLILALDSTAVSASVAVCRDDTPIAAFHLKNGNTHSETLLPMVRDALAVAALSLDDIDLFAVSAGPGSFTGVRIGVATVKGLAFSKNKPVVGVSTLASLAENLVPQTEGTILSPVMNARRGQVYNALFRAENGGIVRVTPDRALSVVELENELAAIGAPFCLAGDGITEALNGFSRLAPLPVSPLLFDQNAVSVAKVAKRCFASGDYTTPEALKPYYLRMPQAERERLEKEKR